MVISSMDISREKAGEILDRPTENKMKEEEDTLTNIFTVLADLAIDTYLAKRRKGNLYGQNYGANLPN